MNSFKVKNIGQFPHMTVRSMVRNRLLHPETITELYAVMLAHPDVNADDLADEEFMAILFSQMPQN